MAAFFVLKKIILSISLVFLFSFLFSQRNDSLNVKRLYTSLAIDDVLNTGSYFVLNELWYKDYEQSDLHWFNDCDEWLQVDKLGHSFSTYYVSSIYSSQMRWSGVNSRNSAIIGSALGFTTISMIELLDAKSEQWGASVCDLGANFTGASLFLAQELLWQEQRVVMKFSYHTTSFPDYRGEILGNSFSERLLKDYNAQTYWLSANVYSFIEIDWFPKYLNIAVGYGATGMLGGKGNPEEFAYFDRERQYFFSLDIDLRRIPVKSIFLRKVFKVLNIIKIPMPTIEFRSGRVYGHYLYF